MQTTAIAWGWSHRLSKGSIRIAAVLLVFVVHLSLFRYASPYLDAAIGVGMKGFATMLTGFGAGSFVGAL